MHVLEWKLVLSEYLQTKKLYSYLPIFTETKGVPFLGIEENNKFTLKDKLEDTIISKLFWKLQ